MRNLYAVNFNGNHCLHKEQLQLSKDHFLLVRFTMLNIIPGYCTLCRSRCGTLNEVIEDHLIKVRPNPEHPNGKAMCMKGKAAPELGKVRTSP
ncbi:hypothetical protein RJO58_004697 [Enterobacter hormaechei]|nr:hypothetical protein [Enterobacter hormaechei]